MSMKLGIESIIADVIREHSLADDSVYLAENLVTSKSGEKRLNSLSLCLYERDYPSDPNKVSQRSKSLLVMNIRQKSKIRLQIRNEQFEAVQVPEEAEIKKLESQPDFTHVIFDEGEAFLSLAIKKYIEWQLICA